VNIPKQKATLKSHIGDGHLELMVHRFEDGTLNVYVMARGIRVIADMGFREDEAAKLEDLFAKPAPKSKRAILQRIDAAVYAHED
jgi:hypothetical protein